MSAHANFPQAIMVGGAPSLAGRYRERQERLLQRHLDAAERILGELDALDGEADLEPSLAGFNPLGSFDDREGDGDGDGGGCADEEPNLGSLGGTALSAASQLRWAGGDMSDQEEEHDGREPVSEDEGAQCEDEGADGDGAGTPNPVWNINGLPMWRVHGADAPLDPDDDPEEITAARCEVGLS